MPVPLPVLIEVGVDDYEEEVVITTVATTTTAANTTTAGDETTSESDNIPAVLWINLSLAGVHVS